MKQKSRNPGFTLIEVVISVFIAGVCLTAALLGLNVISQKVTGTIQLTQARALAQDEIERVKRIPFRNLVMDQFYPGGTALPGKGNYLDPYTVSVDSRTGIFHAYTDTQAQRTEYFVVYKNEGLQRVTLTNEASTTAPIQVYREQSDGTPISTFVQGTDWDWPTPPPTDNRTITFTTTSTVGNRIRVVYLPLSTVGGTPTLTNYAVQTQILNYSTPTNTSPAIKRILVRVYPRDNMNNPILEMFSYRVDTQN